MNATSTFTKTNAKSHRGPSLSHIQSKVASTNPRKFLSNTKSFIADDPPVYQVSNFERSFPVCKPCNYYRSDRLGPVGPHYPHLDRDLNHGIPPLYRSIDLDDFQKLAKDPLFIFNPKQPDETSRLECMVNKDGSKKRST